jgi:hypothetical protein
MSLGTPEQICTIVLLRNGWRFTKHNYNREGEEGGEQTMRKEPYFVINMATFLVSIY